mmetsp:Transcript_33493/g.51345  ORF Transcript_33493/g.51345 Transcript_33493/m.51345 type:complete len:363 (-) Transcript_33493:135-1223(-)
MKNHFPKLFVNLLALNRADFIKYTLSSILIGTTKPIDEPRFEKDWKIKLPLDECTGGSYCVRLRVFGAGSPTSSRFYRAAVDTGSPYLVLSGDRDIYKQTGNFRLSDSNFPPTEEIYGSVSGSLQWKRGRLDFRSNPRISSDDTILAMMDDQLEVEAGGTLLGLVKHPNPPRQKDCYRPTWLEQVRFRDGSSVRSFSIDQENLVLSNKSLLKKDAPRIRLTDLRPLGDFIEHYCFEIQELNLDNRISLTSKDFNGRPIVAVLDTGLTGCLLTQSFWDELTDKGIDPRRPRVITVQAQDTSKTNVVEFVSGRRFNNLFYVAPISLDWFLKEETAPHLIVLGQTFLNQGTLSIDTEERVASFER